MMPHQAAFLVMKVDAPRTRPVAMPWARSRGWRRGVVFALPPLEIGGSAGFRA